MDACPEDFSTAPPEPSAESTDARHVLSKAQSPFHSFLCSSPSATSDCTGACTPSKSVFQNELQRTSSPYHRSQNYKDALFTQYGRLLPEICRGNSSPSCTALWSGRMQECTTANWHQVEQPGSTGILMLTKNRGSAPARSLRIPDRSKTPHAPVEPPHP